MPAAASTAKTVTYTIKATPRRPAEYKTIQRLMRLEPSVQKGLKRLAKRRRREENHKRPRAGRMWMVRVPMTRLTRVEPGETFTITVTPQLLPDLKSVEKYLDAKAAR